MGEPGGSARAEYERRRANDLERRRKSFKWSLVFVLLTPVFVYAAVRVGALALNPWLISTWFHRYGVTGTSEVMDGVTANRLGLLLAAVATVRVVGELWGARPTTVSWRKGYEGEVMTAAALDRLPASFTVIHDLRMPVSRANIDHLVIGPTGVFTIETKHYTSGVIIRRGQARHAGRSMDPAIVQANKQAEAVRALLDAPVRAIVCIQGASVEVDGWFTKPIVDGVLICGGARLTRAIAKLNATLTEDEVQALAARCRQRLVSALPHVPETPPTCSCGSPMVERHRRSDGRPFWGCTRYPTCRNVIDSARHSPSAGAAESSKPE